MYREKQEHQSPEKLLSEAGWKLEELMALMKNNQRLIVEVHTLRDELSDDTTDRVCNNVALKVSNIRKHLSPVVSHVRREPQLPTFLS